MKPPIEQPTITQHERDGATQESHPAYAVVQANRVSGHAHLFGSDFVHNHYVTIRIAPATLTRSLSNDWIHGSLDHYIEVALSEAQWATFVSTMNMGSGTPCTLTDLHGKYVARLPEPLSRKDQFNDEMAQHLADVITRFDALRAHVANAATVTGRAAILSEIDRLKQELKSNVPFVADQFGEHVEKVTEHAKVEVTAYMTNLIQRAGLTAIAGTAQPPIQLPAADIDTTEKG